MKHSLDLVHISGKFLMTVGGTANKRFVKLYSLNDSVPVPECLRDLNELPDDRFYAAGASLGPG